MSGPLLQGIAALFAALGGIAVFFLKVMLDRQDEARRRRERIDDLVQAVRADVQVERDRLAATFAAPLAQLAEQTHLGHIDAGLVKPMPRTTTGSQSLVVDSLKRDVSVLPYSVIEPVVRFYRLNQGIDALAEAFTSGAYDDIAPERQRLAVSSYFRSGEAALAAAEEALSALHAAQRAPRARRFTRGG